MNPFPAGARVVFVGDSITAANKYTSHIMAYYLENLKDSKVSFFNSAVPGGTTVSQLDYLYDEALIYTPTHAVINLGVNDSRFFLLSDKRSSQRYNDLVFWYENYKKTLPALCDEIEKNGISIILCTPAPYAEYQAEGDEHAHGAYALVAEYANFCRSLAEKRNYPLCDFHSYMTGIMQTETLFDGDRVHPNDRGHYHMAKYFLSCQGFDLGEQKPIPAYLDELNSASTDLAHIFFTEKHIVENYKLPTEQKLQIVRDYIKKQDFPADFYLSISEKYLENKLRQDELIELVIKISDKVFG